MTQYINKDALVAEIKKRINEEIEESSETNLGYYTYGCVDSMRNILSFLDTLDNLEVKEVNLEKEFYDFLDTLTGKDNGHLSEDELFSIADYFFELGLKAQKWE